MLPAMNAVSDAYYLGGDQGAVRVKVRTENGHTVLDISGTKVEPIK